jgi:hypothetical protein
MRDGHATISQIFFKSWFMYVFIYWLFNIILYVLFTYCKIMNLTNIEIYPMDSKFKIVLKEEDCFLCTCLKISEFEEHKWNLCYISTNFKLRLCGTC